MGSTRRTTQPTVSRRTRRTFLAGASGLLALSASGDVSKGALAQSDGTPQASTPGESRTVEHALGTTEVPVNSENFIILDASNTLGCVMSLGMTPTHANEPGGRTPPFDQTLYDAYPETTTIEPFPEQEIDLEQVVRIAPDLIIAETGYIDTIYDQLSQIAPTVALTYEWTDPWADMALVAAALGVPPDRVDELRASFDDAVEAARGRVEGAGQTVSFETLNETGTFDVYKADPPFFVTINAIEQLGFEVTPDHEALGIGEASEPRIDEVSSERFPLLDGDYLVLLQAPTSADDMQALSDGQQSDLYRRGFPAVRDGRVLVADRLVAYGSGGAAGWLAQIEQFVQFLAGEKSN